jgi:hypothetical protein
MQWELVKDDTYYSARRLEETARRQNTWELWRDYANAKAKKGSYALAVHGYMNGAALREQAGDGEQVFDLYARAFDNALRSKSNELALIVAYRHAHLAERLKKWDACIEVYERLGSFCEQRGNYFLAADAYEHAAEILSKTGKDLQSYRKPIELWELNAKYWHQRGEEDDTLWSERHIGLYKKLFEVK